MGRRWPACASSAVAELHGPPPPGTLWDDDPAERRRRLEAAVAYHRTQAAEDAAKVTYLPASSWYVDHRAHAAAEWAARAAARALGLPFVPQIKWFREGGPTDRVTDAPEGFRDRPGVAGYVADGTPDVIWLNVVYGQGGAVAPSLQEVVAHEAEHCRQQLAGLRGRTEGRERLAKSVAAQLLRGEPVAP